MSDKSEYITVRRDELHDLIGDMATQLEATTIDSHIAELTAAVPYWVDGPSIYVHEDEGASVIEEVLSDLDISLNGLQPEHLYYELQKHGVHLVKKMVE